MCSYIFFLKHLKINFSKKMNTWLLFLCTEAFLIFLSESWLVNDFPEYFKAMNIESRQVKIRLNFEILTRKCQTKKDKKSTFKSHDEKSSFIFSWHWFPPKLAARLGMPNLFILFSDYVYFWKNTGHGAVHYVLISIRLMQS